MGRIIPYNKENNIHVLNHQPDPTSNKSTIRGWFIECINMGDFGDGSRFIGFRTYASCLGDEHTPLRGTILLGIFSEAFISLSGEILQESPRWKMGDTMVSCSLSGLPLKNSSTDYYNVLHFISTGYMDHLGTSFLAVKLPQTKKESDGWAGLWRASHIYIWRFVKMYVPGFVDKSQFHARRLMFAFKKHDLPWWRENVEILRYLWKSF